jgi:hypothetical protein
MLGRVPTDSLLDVADALYGLPHSEFTAARDTRARELKAADPALSTRVKALRKPSVAAWVVNLLVRREAAQVEQVLSVGAALREAQASLDGDELRALTRQRRQLTAAVTAQAKTLAAEAGQRVTAAVAEQVEATLTAAMVDPGAAVAVRSWLLVATLSATGVDVVDVAAALAVPEALGFSATPRAAEPPPRPELQIVADPEPDLAARAAAEQALAEAEDALTGARKTLETARGRVGELQAETLQIQGELDELRRQVADLESRAEATDDDLTDAEQQAEDAEDEIRTALAVRDRAKSTLESLG